MQTKSLVGQVYGRLTVLQSAGAYVGKSGKRNGLKWLCQCSCGNQVEVYGGSLKKGTTQSCGCLASELTSKRFRSKEGESACKRLFHTYRTRAKKRGLSFPLSIEDFKELTSSPCAYCGAPPVKKVETSSGRIFYGAYTYNGIDRVDNNIGYEVDNVVPCCTQCNMMKHTYSEEEFLEKVKAIYTHLELGS